MHIVTMVTQVGLALVLMFNVVFLYWMWSKGRGEAMWGIGSKKKVITGMMLDRLWTMRKRNSGLVESQDYEDLRYLEVGLKVLGDCVNDGLFDASKEVRTEANRLYREMMKGKRRSKWEGSKQ